VSCRKPGNVHPDRSFSDTSYLDFILSAAAIAPALELAPTRPLGETVLDAVGAMRAMVGMNTHLGIILLLAPLCSLPEKTLLASGTEAGKKNVQRAIKQVLSGLTRRDCELVYEAIRLAAPGGIGETDRGDVREAPDGTLSEMMALASERDLVARQYTNGFENILEEGVPTLASALSAERSLEEAVVLCHLHFIARHGDSLILRKCGDSVSAEAARRAQEVLDSHWPLGDCPESTLRTFDDWLRSDGNRRNPGTSADLTTASLFLAMAAGIIHLPLASGMGR
jgi:triphosphoribosyl-dephospho-CoA synthase